MSMNIIRKITHEEVIMLHMLGILPRHIFGLAGHPLLDQALKPGKLYKTLRLLLPQYGFTPGYPETLLLRALHIMQAQEAAGVVTISCFDTCYPKRLLEIDDFPPLIYCLGDCTLLSCDDVITIVGAKENDDEGDRVSWRLGHELGVKHIVLSELSDGCNAAVLRGCLDGGGKPIVVSAQGLDMPLSPNLEELRTQILDHGGVVFTEHPFNSKPSSRCLMKRFRLHAVLSNMLIIAQASAEQSDMSHVVKFARYYYKPIKAWRYTSKNDVNAGNFALIGSGVASSIVLE